MKDPRSSVLAVGSLTASALVLAVGLAWTRQPQPTTPAANPTPAPAASPAAATATATDNLYFGRKSPIARPAKSIRVVNWNIENLFDDQDDPALSGPNEDKDQTKPAAHLQAAAGILKTLDADIVAIEEVESEHALVWFRDTYLKDLGYQYIASVDAGDPRGIEQAVLSRFPISNIENWPKKPLEGVQPEMEGNRPNPLAGQPLAFHRSPLRVSVEAPASALGSGKPYNLTLLVLHSKSGRGSAYWREAEAKGTIAIVRDMLKAQPDLNLAVVGDFNALPSDQSYLTYLQGGLIDVMSRDLKTGGPVEHTDVASLDLWTTHASGRIIDHVLIAPGMVNDIDWNTRFVMGIPQRDPAADYRTTPPPPGYASDHLPLVIDIIKDEGPAAAPTAIPDNSQPKAAGSSGAAATNPGSSPASAKP